MAFLSSSPDQDPLSVSEAERKLKLEKDNKESDHRLALLAALSGRGRLCLNTKMNSAVRGGSVPFCSVLLQAFLCILWLA